MRTQGKFIILYGLFFSHHAFAISHDSLFIADVTKFAFKEIGITLQGEFYKRWSKDQPLLYMYVSEQHKVALPEEFSESFIYCGYDQRLADSLESRYRLKGFQTFVYRAYANSSTRLNIRLLSYPKEAIVFIVFHELIHNYISQRKINIPYDFNEALCDVIGNYGSLKYALSTKRIDSALARKQIANNEKIYSFFNLFISQINEIGSAKASLYEKCNRIKNEILKECDQFQNERFGYDVNNAFLLKNQNYCKNYFLLKDLFLKQNSIESLLKVVDTLFQKNPDVDNYIDQLR